MKAAVRQLEGHWIQVFNESEEKGKIEKKNEKEKEAPGIA
jgi:hypothetical protein